MATQLQLPFDDDGPRGSSSRVCVQGSESLIAASPDPPKTPPAPRLSRRQVMLAYVQKLYAGEVEIVVHDNRSTMLSTSQKKTSPKKTTLTLRMHHMFLQATDEVLEQVARFAIQPDRRSRRVVNAYIEDNAHLISAEISRQPVRSRGQHHDLRDIFDRLNSAYFEGQVKAELGFGDAGSPKRRRRRSIKLGSYDRSARRIVIHPALDQEGVPVVFVEYVVFHEMLHQLYPTRSDGQRLVFHPPELRRAERAFAGRKAALLWYRQNEDLLLAYRPGRRVQREHEVKT